MRTRLDNLFGHGDSGPGNSGHGESGRGDSAEARQAARDAAERAQYEANVRSAQQRVHAAMEGDPRVRQLRQEARNADFDRLRAEGERNARQIDAVNARNDARLAHEAAESLRQRAERIDPADPRRNELMERAQRMEAEAAHHEARGQQAEARAQQAEQRVADAQRRIGQANHSANEITRAIAGQRRGLWRWANVEAEGQFRMVGPDHPGPRVSALTGREVPPPVWSNRPYGSEGGLRQVLHVDQARLEQALSDGHGGYVRTPDPKGGWLRLLNAFGLPADPTRAQNCLDTVASLFDTFVHGRPTVAAPRTYDGYRNGNGGMPLFGERGGPGRMEDLTGGRYQALVGDLTGQRTDQVVAKVGAGFDRIHQQLIDGGHGSFASIITGWRGGGSHAWAAVNYEGVVHFVDPQQGKVVIAEPHAGGLRFVDPATGNEVPHPIFDPAGIKAMDALVVDGQARPMPFGDRPPGMWNDRPMTADYLSHQPPDVRSAQTAQASHRAVLSERDQAVSDANQARSARQDALRQASDAQAHQAREQEAARQAGVQQGQRDAAWDQANQQRALALRHDEAAQHYTQRLQQGGGPQELHDAATRAQQHAAAAEQARAHEARLRNEAYQHDNARQQAETAQRYWQNEATQAQQREATATRAADWFEQQARVHERQATQLESRYSQDAERAADDHDQQAVRYRQEASRYQQEAAQHQTGDPRQEAADRMRQHYERLAHAAGKARDGYRMVHRLEESAAQHDSAAEQHEQQADAWRRHAVQQERLTAQHEQARVEEEAHASARFERADELRRAADDLAARGGAEDLARAAELRRQADEVRRAGEQHRAEAVNRQQARDTAADEAQRGHKIAQTADAAAANERAAAARDRQAAPNWQHSAKAWHDNLRGTRAIDPSAHDGTGPEFRPEDLRPDLRARFDALTDQRARAAFEAKFHQARGDQDRLERALEGIRAGAEARGHTLEHALVEQHERDLLKQAARDAIPEPPEDVKREIQTQLDYVARVRTRIESYVSRHPEVAGTERWRRTIEQEAAQLARELRGENRPSVQKALDRGNNVRGVESEIALAERTRNVTEVAKPITVKLADGRDLSTDVDVVADNGKRWIWRDSKDYHSFGVESSDFAHARDQVIRQLRILLSGEYHRDGGPPRLEWHFPRGVDTEVADALEAIRVTDTVTGRQSRTHIYVVGDRLVGGERPPEPPAPYGAEAPGAETPGGPAGHEAGQLFSRDAPRSNLDVLLHGTDVPHDLEAVHYVAELIGVDLSGVRVELVVDPEEIRYLDAQGAAAYTPVEKGGTEIRLGPASFADPETLAATVAHEFTHVEQLRSAAELSTATRGALEDLAYASEEPALAAFRARFQGWGEGVGGEVLDRDGLRSSATERAAGFRDGDGRGRLGGDGAPGGEHGHRGSGSGGRVREPGGPADRPDHPAAGARAEQPGGAGSGADRPELTGGESEAPAPGVHSGHDPARMFRDPTAGELAELGVGRATLADLGFPDGAGLSPELREVYEHALRRTALLDPHELRFTQRSVSPETSDGIAVDDLANLMRESGWRGGPIHAVRWGDGSVSSLDNRRLRAALDAGLERIPVVVHAPGERLADWPHDWPTDRMARNALIGEVRESPDGRWVVGGDEGPVVFESGRVPRTWGEIAVFRAADQRSLLPGHLFGADRPPVLLEKPPPPHAEPVLDDGERLALHDAVRDAESVATAVRTDLDAVAASVSARLHLTEPIELRGLDHQVKDYDSLARKYHDEAKILGREVGEFVGTVNDTVRFTLRLPGGGRYADALVHTLDALQRDEGYTVVEAKNFWLEGNRHYGLNVTVREPHEGRLVELQFPVDASWRAGNLTHDLYGVVRREDELAVRQVHAFLAILEVNKRLGLAEVIPDGLADLRPPTDRGFAYWASRHPDVWRAYKDWLAENGLRFADVVDEFHLDRTDFPVRDGVEQALEAADVELLRGLRQGSGLDAAAGDHRAGGPFGRRADLEPPGEGVAVRPADGPALHLRRPEPGAPGGGRPGDGAAGDGAGDGPGAVAGRGHDRLDLPLEGQPAAGGGPGVADPAHWAEHAYEVFRSDHTDVAEIAAKLADVPRADGTVGFSRAEIEQVKQHVFMESHDLDVYDDRGEVVDHDHRPFDADPDIAEAWIRLRRGAPLPEDLVLLEHELHESNFMRADPHATYADAHVDANRRFNWENTVPDRTGEDLTQWERQHGHSSAVPEGQGDGPRGGVHVRLSGDGPATDHRQDGSQLQSGGRLRGPRQPGGADPGHGASGDGGSLAGRGRDPGLTGTPEEAYRRQIELALHRVAGGLGESGHGDLVRRVEVGDDGLATVTPREGRPFALRLRAEDIGGDTFRVSLGSDGVRQVSIPPELIDGSRGVRTDAVVARAIGHASGEVAAEGRSRRLGFLRRFGQQDVLTNAVESGGRGRLSVGDLAKVGEFQALTRLREGVTGPRRTEWVDREIGRFIERHGLRDGVPGAGHRAELIDRYLSERERAALAEYRAAWRDSDPARALARHVLAEGVPGGAKVEPLGLGTREFRDVYRVEPKGWAREGRLGFTIEVESGRPRTAGALVEITGTDLPRHFRLVVDRGLLANGTRAGDAELRLREAIGDALHARIGEQHNRPPEIPDWRVRMVDRAATVAAGGGGFEVAEVLGAGTVAFKLAGGALADVLTAGYLGRHAALDAAQASHERALARSLQVSRTTVRELRAGTGEVRAEVESIADALGVPRSQLHWTAPKRATDPIVSTMDIPEHADRALRERVDGSVDSLVRDAKNVTAIRDPRWGRDLRVSVEHGPDAKVRLEVGNTPDRAKVEVAQDGRRYTLRVPPELMAGDEGTLHKAVAKAFEKVAAQQHEVAAKVAHPAVQHAKNAAVDVAQGLGSMVPQDMASPHAGAANVLATVMRKAGEAVASPLTAEHKAGQAVGGKAFDSDRTAASVRDTDLGNAATTARDAADNLTYLARAADYRAAHGTDADPATLTVPHRTGDPMPAAYEAMSEVGQRHAGRVTLVDADHSQDGAGARHLRYRLDVARGNRVRLDVTMHDDATGAPRLVVKRAGWGRFEVEVHGAAEPDAVHKLVGDVAETIVERRGQGLPTLSEYLRGKLLPTAVNAGTVMVVFAETHALPGLAVGGVTVTGGMLKGVSEYVHELHLSDKAVEQRFAKLDVTEVHTGDLRTAFARTGGEVERFESRAADGLRQRLTELDDARRQPDLTDERRAELDEQSTQVRERLDSLPPPDVAVLTPLHDTLPRLTLPRNAEVRLVDADNHVFSVSFDRGLTTGGPARESVAFDVVTGETGGRPVRLVRVNSDVGLTAVVDPHARPEHVREAIASALRYGISDGSLALPSERPGAGSQLLGATREATSAASQVGAGLIVDAVKVLGTLAATSTTATGTVVGGVARVVAEARMAETKAQRAFARDLAENLRSGKASARQLGVFNGRAAYEAGRLRTAQEILDWLAGSRP